ncbi:MAG TPA: HdeD family acid-resistance protein [Bryobacteraceae bacterium]|nr:HdeD family acid-resistance protein [Bryobacteraceae bacterium]
MSYNDFLENPLASDINEIRSSWGWFLALGIVLTLLGAFCIVANVTVTFTTVLMVGWLLLFGAMVSLVHAFRVHTWSGFFLYLVSALLRGFTGYVFIRYPLSGAAGLTLVLASFLIVGGIFRTIASAALHFPRWGWAASSGVVSAVLGGMLLAQMPASSIWFIGFAVGVEMIADGASLMVFSTAIHGLPETYHPRTA